MTTAACISLLRVFVAAIVMATISKSYAFGGRVHGLWSLCSLSVCEWLCECKLCAWASHLAMCVLRMRAAEGGWVGGWVGERVGGWWFCVAFVWRLCVAALRGCFACGLCARRESRTKCIATRDNHFSESRTIWCGNDSAVRLQKQRAAIVKRELCSAVSVLQISWWGRRTPVRVKHPFVRRRFDKATVAATSHW